ncbi:MAG: small basic protein [Candidatus Omnitrophica bacterium]|nr:small basic protein [Candidatus Omnitrophota bacterium]
MSIHSSLKSTNTMKRHRSVLSRLERIKILSERGPLDLEHASVLGLPKVKHLKIRVRKEKAAAAPATAEAAAAAPGTAPPASAGTSAKAAPPAKGAAAKPAAKAGGPGAKSESPALSKKKE